MVPAAGPRATSVGTDSVAPVQRTRRVAPASRGRRAAPVDDDPITDLDRAIIDQLQRDGRRPYTRIAQDLGVAESTIRARTERLMDRGVLQVVGVTDPLQLGYDQMAMVGVHCSSDRLLDVADEVAALPEVTYVVITAGTYDLLVETVCRDNAELLTFLAEKLRRIPGVVGTETFVYLRITKQSFHWSNR
ncbi:MAG: Lrp/AsnC family transcriptional regulator [Chloroflexi bacterium]|nr:Lrp/AsnC family transcriptional regulator [Chloroflexota bacterium]